MLTQVLKYQNKTIACREELVAYMYAFNRKPASCSTRISKRTTLAEKPYMGTFLIVTNGLRSTKLSKSIRREHLHLQVVSYSDIGLVNSWQPDLDQAMLDIPDGCPNHT